MYCTSVWKHICIQPDSKLGNIKVLSGALKLSLSSKLVLCVITYIYPHWWNSSLYVFYTLLTPFPFFLCCDTVKSKLLLNIVQPRITGGATQTHSSWVCSDSDLSSVYTISKIDCSTILCTTTHTLLMTCRCFHCCSSAFVPLSRGLFGSPILQLYNCM